MYYAVLYLSLKFWTKNEKKGFAFIGYLSISTLNAAENKGSGFHCVQLRWKHSK